MAELDNLANLAFERHLLEQLAYEEIRHYMSQQFLLDPPLFMHTHGCRPEDLNGAQLRTFYREALKQGINVRQTSPEHFRRKFQAGLIFGRQEAGIENNGTGPEHF